MAALIDFIDLIAGQPDGQRARRFIQPVGFGHLGAVQAKPLDILHLRAANRAALKKLPPPEDRVLVKEAYQAARELQQFAAFVVEIPIEPRKLVVLAVSVVVATLRAAKLVAGL